MAKDKVTITIDRAKVQEAAACLGDTRGLSQLIDIALDRLIRAERIRTDVAAYRSMPQSADEDRIALAAADTHGLADETDWEALYPEDGA